MVNCINMTKALCRLKPLYQKPINIGSLRYAPEYLSAPTNLDTFKRASNILPLNSSLFPWASQRPRLTFNGINPESLVLVHRTNYFPPNGRILSTNLSTASESGVGECRTTIHFALNKSVTEHWAGNSWNDSGYAILLPFRETVESMPKSKIIGGIADDFFFLDSVVLPKGSVVLQHNSEIAPNILKVSEISEGVRLVESGGDINTLVDTVIKKWDSHLIWKPI